MPVSGTTDEVIFRVKVRDKELSQGAVRITNNFKTLANEVKKTNKVNKIGKFLWKDLIKTWQHLISLGTKLVKVVLVGIWKGLKKIGEIAWETGKDILQSFAKWEEQAVVAERTIGHTAERTSEWFLKLEEDVRHMGRTILKGVVSFEDLGEAMGIAGQMGIESAEDILKLVETAGRASVVTDMTVKSYTEGVGRIMKVFNVDIAENAEMVLNLIDIYGNKIIGGQGKIVAMTESMAGTFNTAGFSIQEALKLAAVAIEAGEKKTGTAGRNIGKIFNSMVRDYKIWAEELGIWSGHLKYLILENPYKALELVIKKMEELRAEPEGLIKLNVALKKFNISGVRTEDIMKKLISAKKAFKKITALEKKELDGANTSVKEFNILAPKFHKQLQALGIAVKGVGIAIGKWFGPVLAKFLETYINPFLHSLAEWAEKSQLLKDLSASLSDILMNHLGPWLEKIGKDFIAWLEGIDKGIIEGEIDMISFHATILRWGTSFKKQLERIWNWLVKTKNEFKIWYEKDWPELHEKIVMTWKALPEFMKSATAFFSTVSSILSKTKEVLLFLLPALRDITVKIDTAKEAGKEFGEVMTTDSVLPEMVEWADKAAISIGNIDLALSNVNLKLAHYENLMQKSAGFLSAGGMIGVARKAKQARAQKTALEFVQLQQPQAAAGQPQILEATLIMGDQEVGRLTGILSRTLKEQDDRRYAPSLG